MDTRRPALSTALLTVLLAVPAHASSDVVGLVTPGDVQLRSEERRVGKEC